MRWHPLHSSAACGRAMFHTARSLRLLDWCWAVGHSRGCHEASLGWTPPGGLSARPRRQEPLLGTFPYFSSKLAPGAGQARGRCIAHIFAMRVAEELPTWPEGCTRKRVWVRRSPRPRACPRA